MKRFLSVLVAVLLCIPFAACKSNDQGSLFKYDIDADPINLDPQSASDYNSLLVIQNIFEGLLTYTADGKLTEGVATDWKKSDNGLEYAFTLRQDAKWSNGETVTADDFVFAFRRLFSKDTNAPNVSDFFCIKNGEAAYNGKKALSEIGVSAPAPDQLVFTLQTPNVMFLQLLTTAAAMPCNEAFFYQTKGKYGLEAKTTVDGEEVYLIQGNGPFYLKQWVHDDYLALRQNSYYQGAQVPLAYGVNFLIAQQPDTEEPFSFEQYRINRFLEKQTDALQLSGGSGDALQLENFQSDKYESTTWGILFNQRHPVLSDPDIRKALFYLNDTSAYQYALPANTDLIRAIIPGQITMLDQNYRSYAGMDILPKYQPEPAKKAYQKGLERLQITKVEDIVLYLTQGTGQEELFAYLSQVWQRELGFYTTVKAVSEQELAQHLRDGDYAMAFYSLSGSYNSPDSILNQFTSSAGSNYCGYQNKTYDGYLTDALRSAKLAESASLFQKAEKRLIDDGVFLPIYSEHTFFICHSGVSGIMYDPQSKTARFAFAEK